ncbi:unnamed protein product, partial [Allacma fusca]
NSFYYVPAL